ncbi:hypothetical protein FHS29_002848 [Saccharothrix tamanrassetensis]|uniref:Chaplin domain-containing protein n=1 Tax=Saccharothrix tamanrassetensis TaxID=1051531 RepID=A0A841CCK8_9PSEU|nr:hypothetical protein [Saccharothrix tamanrassetensis]MBB5956262.1 hypothetical protein [Saccharothrix tamanrassetensis]
MLKKAGAIVGIAAGLMMLGSPAFAAGDGAHWTNGPIVSALNGNNVNAVVGVCGNNVGVLGAAVPINSPVFIDNCAAGGIVDGDDVNVNG